MKISRLPPKVSDRLKQGHFFLVCSTFDWQKSSRKIPTLFLIKVGSSKLLILKPLCIFSCDYCHYSPLPYTITLIRFFLVPLLSFQLKHL